MVSGVCGEGKVAVLNRLVKARLTQKVRSEQRLEAEEGRHLVAFWRTTCPGRGQPVWSPEVGAHPACLKESRKAGVAAVE